MTNNTIKINKAVQGLIDNAYDIKLESKHEQYPKVYSEEELEEVELSFKLKNHPFTEEPKGQDSISYDVNFGRDLKRYRTFKETKTPQE